MWVTRLHVLVTWGTHMDWAPCRSESACRAASLNQHVITNAFFTYQITIQLFLRVTRCKKCSTYSKLNIYLISSFISKEWNVANFCCPCYISLLVSTSHIKLELQNLLIVVYLVVVTWRALSKAKEVNKIDRDQETNIHWQKYGFIEFFRV